MSKTDHDELKQQRESRIRSRNQTRILQEAVHLFASKGFDGTRLSEIAERCGLPRANIYYYFSSKEGIYTALIERVIDGWDRAFECIRTDRDPADAIREYVRAKLEYSRAHPVESRFFANEILRGARFLADSHRQHIREVTDSRAEVVNEWIRQGRLAPVDPYHFFVVLWSSTQFYADYSILAADILHKDRLTEADFEAACDTISNTVLEGCCGPDPMPVPASHPGQTVHTVDQWVRF